MPSVREYFVSESRDYLGALRDALSPGAAPDAHGLLRHTRALRGAAQMAGEEAVARVATVFEAGARALVHGAVEWSDEVGTVIGETVDALETLVERPPDASDAEPVTAAIERWRAFGVEPGLPTARSRPQSRPDRGPAGSASARAETGGMAVPDTFRAFAAREAERVLAALDAALAELRERPLDREPLKTILRRQRALLGAAALDSLPALAETLHSIDEVTRLVAHRNPAVTGDWRVPYAAARDVLAWVVPRIRGGEPVDDGPEALTRLRHARERLEADHGDSAPEASAAPNTPSQEISAEDLATFRREAAALLEGIRTMTDQLAAAKHDRRNALRRELREALTALSNNARAFRMSDAAALALTGRAWVEAGDPAALDSLFARLRNRIGIEPRSESPSEPAPESEPELQPRPQAERASEPESEGALEHERVPEPEPASRPSEPARQQPEPTPERKRRPRPASPPVPIEEFEYRGEAALRRALEVRSALESDLESALASDPEARARLEEVFDLIRLALE